jgi:hypothetical protein
MCFSADASAGAAAALLPVGGYCLATAWRKNRAYLPLAAVPLLFGLQQLCEARVWDALDRGDPGMARGPSLMFLFFALALWPVWVPLAVVAIEPPGRTRFALSALAACGFAIGLVYSMPVVANDGLSPAVVGHSIRYDFSAVPATRSDWWWVWPALYLAAVCLPPLVSRNRHLRPLGGALILAAAVTYALFAGGFASVWCFFATVLSLYLALILHQLPERVSPPGGGEGPTLAGAEVTPRPTGIR